MSRYPFRPCADCGARGAMVSPRAASPKLRRVPHSCRGVRARRWQEARDYYATEGERMGEIETPDDLPDFIARAAANFAQAK